jgi:hypothetical protein
MLKLHDILITWVASEDSSTNTYLHLEGLRK